MLHLKGIVPTLILIVCAVPACRLVAQDGFRWTPAPRSTTTHFSENGNRQSRSTEIVGKPTSDERFLSLESVPPNAQRADVERSRQLVDGRDDGSVTRAATDNSFEGRLAALEKFLEADQAVDGIDVSEETFSSTVGGRFFLDSIYGTSDDLERTNNRSNFSNQGYKFKALRLRVVGKGYGIFDYKIQLDFKDFNDPIARDLYLGADFPIGYFRIGHFKEPFGLEQLTSVRYITFMERSLMDAMVPARNIGIDLRDQWGEDGNGTWVVGTFFDHLQDGTDFNDDGQTEADDNDSRAFTARLTYLPYYCADGRYLVHVGGAFRHVDVDPGRSVTFRAKPEIDSGAVGTLLGVRTGPANGYQQWGGEAAVVWGSFSLQGELMTTQIENAADSYLWGGYIYASYFLTGEHREYNKQYAVFSRVHPLENFWWVDSDCEDCNFGHGAWELAARFSYLDYDQPGLTPNLDNLLNPIDSRGELTNFTVGVNWYWTPHIRMMFNYVYSELDDADTGARATVNGFTTRFQFDF